MDEGKGEEEEGDEVEGDGEGEEGDGDEEEDEEDEENNSAIELYFQPKFQGNLETKSQKTFRIRCKLEVIHALLDEAFYDQLRAKEQLGYNV